MLAISLVSKIEYEKGKPEELRYDPKGVPVWHSVDIDLTESCYANDKANHFKLPSP